jgi:hypothetical protein
MTLIGGKGHLEYLAWSDRILSRGKMYIEYLMGINRFVDVHAGLCKRAWQMVTHIIPHVSSGLSRDYT